MAQGHVDEEWCMCDDCIEDEKEQIASVGLSCGRNYLEVAGIIVAMEGDKCRASNLPEEILPQIPKKN